MTSIPKLTLLAAGLALSLGCNAATYTFSGFFGEPLPPGETDYTATFSFSVPGTITADTTIPASALTSCTTHASPCESISFYMDAAAAGLAPFHPDWEAIAFSTGQSISYYYFEAPTFSVDGTHDSISGVGPATLTVSSVPEPAATALLGGGLLLVLGASAARRRGPGMRATRPA